MLKAIYRIIALSPTLSVGGRRRFAVLLAAAMSVAAVPAMAESQEVQPAEVESTDEIARHDIPVHPELVSAEARAKSKLRRMLKKTGLDPELIIERVERELAAAGGPFTPYPTDPKVAEEAAADADRRFQSIVGSVEEEALIDVAMVQIPFGEPVTADGRYSSKFGYRKDPFNGRSAFHAGVDYAAPEGTVLLATADGEVVEAGWLNGYGNLVQIRHEFGLETVYAHLNQIRVEVGDQVQRGEWIGDMGSTGRSTGSHLHYEIRQDGAALDPMKFIEAGRDVYEEQN